MGDGDEKALGRSFLTHGRAAAIDHQEEAAGSQTGSEKPSQTPPLPFFNKPAYAAAIPDTPTDDEFAKDIASLIKKWIQKHVGSQTGHCPTRPALDISRWRKCQCTSPAKFSPEGYGNCNFGAMSTAILDLIPGESVPMLWPPTPIPDGTGQE